MLKLLFLCMALAVSCIGCDTAAKQQQAEDARKAATAAQLKQAGEDMHNKNQAASPDDETETESP